MCFSVLINRDLKYLKERFHAEIDGPAFFHLNELKERYPDIYKTPESDQRVFPNTFAPVLVYKDGKRMIRPMRYRLRPAGSLEEVPSKYNLFNARRDSLDKRSSWTPIWGKQHALFPFIRFFEWVAKPDGSRQLVSFKSDSRDLMWAPAIYDRWQSVDGQQDFESFAIITDDPPVEVLQAGHDRCPIFLKEELIDQWLYPEGQSKKELDQLFDQKEQDIYSYQLEEAPKRKKEDRSQLKLL